MSITLDTNKYYLALIAGTWDDNGYTMNGAIKASSATSWFIHNMGLRGSKINSFFSYSNYNLTVTAPNPGGIHVIELR